MNFDLQNISLVTLYGFFQDELGLNPRHVQIPIAPPVQNELKSMLSATIDGLELPASEATMETFDPAQKYSSEEKLKISLTTPYLQELADTVGLTNVPSDINALNAVSELQYYYAIFSDNQSRNLFGFRRASQFKGVSRSRLTLIDGGVLRMVSGPVFRLDNDFDYLVSAQDVFIYRPSGFEFTTNVGSQILQAAAGNAQSIAAALTYLDLGGVSAFATVHKRSARLLAAIKGRSDLDQIDRGLLVQACQNFGISITNPTHGQLSPGAGYEHDFLCVLDRRAYTATLIPQQLEKYEAANRTQK